MPTLKEKLQEYHSELCKKLTDFGAEVTDFGIIDSERKGYELLPHLKAADCDVWFCNMITYATSSVFAPIMRDADRPVVLTALQPLNALYYTKANIHMQLENDCICSVPEYMGVANRLGKKISDVMIGTLNGNEKADKDLLLVLSLVFERNTIVNALKKGTVLSAACGICNGATNYLVMVIIAAVASSVFFPVLSAGQLILTFIISVTLYREEFIPRQIAGLVCGLVSLILLNI